MKNILLEFITDAVIGLGGLSVLFTSVELGLKIVVGIGTCILLYYRIKKAIKESK